MVNKKNTFLEKVRYLWRHSFYRLSDTLSVELLITDPRIFQQFPTLKAVAKVSMTASAVAEEFHLDSKTRETEDLKFPEFSGLSDAV